MSIPFNTTRIKIERSQLYPDATNDLDPADPYDPDEPQQTYTVAKGVRAVIGSPSASVVLSTGERTVYTATLTCDPADIQGDDLVTEENGDQWIVLWARLYGTFGVKHINGSLRKVVGVQA